jgi:hypothetical protein
VRTSALVVLALLAVAMPGAASGPPDPDREEVIEAFEEWATSNGHKLLAPACSDPEPQRDGTTIIVCYGISHPLVVTGITTVDDSGEPQDFVAFPPPAPASAPPSTTPQGFPTSFGDGTYRVNVDIGPGTYQTTTAEPDCTSLRVPGVEPPPAATFPSDTAGGTQRILVILPTDLQVSTEACGVWNLVEP